MRRSLFLAFPLFAMLACSSTNANKNDESLATATGRIINGQLDGAHDAVVAILMTDGNTGGACTGTIVKVDAANHIGFVLTAAHCAATTLPPVMIMRGPDYDSPQAIRYSVIDYKAHPNYQASNSGSPYDFGVIRIAGVDASTPTMPVMTQANDSLKNGSTVVSVGYGQTDTSTTNPNPNSKRYNFTASLNDVQSQIVGYSLARGGICHGDSGGPLLVTIGGQETIAGVHSYVSGNCGSGEGYSGRISIITSSWLATQLALAPPADSCKYCTAQAESGAGVCAQKQTACMNDASCKTLYDCLTKCQDATCQNTCMKATPTGEGPLFAVSACPCTTACTSQCAGDTSCQNIPQCGVSVSGQCGKCLDTGCCAEALACSENGVCYYCTKSNNATGCDQSALYQAYESCKKAKCTVDCGVSGGGGSSGGSGGSTSPGGSGGASPGSGAGGTPGDTSGTDGTDAGEGAAPGDSPATTTTTTSGCSTSNARARLGTGGLGVLGALFGLGRLRRRNRKAH